LSEICSQVFSVSQLAIDPAHRSSAVKYISDALFGIPCNLLDKLTRKNFSSAIGSSESMLTVTLDDFSDEKRGS
jgi:hypothetical protein